MLYDSMWPPFPQHPLTSTMQKEPGAHGSELSQPAASAQNVVHKAGLQLPPRQQREIKPSLGCFCILGNSENLPPTRSNFLPPSSPVNYQRAPSLSPEPDWLRAESSWLPTPGKSPLGSLQRGSQGPAPQKERDLKTCTPRQPLSYRQ